LAIEEQFYWLSPFAVYLLPLRGLARLSVALIALAWAWRSAMFHLFPDRPVLMTVLLFGEMDFLAWGALGTIIRPYLVRFEYLMPSLVGVSAVLFASTMIWRPEWINHIALGLFAPFFLCVLLLASSSPRISAILETRGLGYLGRISYGLYLYHLPVIFLAARWRRMECLSSLIPLSRSR
jgi:peptidoglycan/LPS O-acetylase OafA/YrhL